MILKKIKLKVFSIVIVILCGCNPNINNHYDFNPKQFNKINSQLDNWQLNGKISWHHKPTNHSAMCYMDWQKNNKKSKITFRSAMNIKNVTIESDDGKINIVSSSNNLDEVQKDIQDISKTISLNLNNLNYWLLGVPNLTNSYLLVKDGFKQQDWEILYSKYKSYGGFMLPTKITMRNAKSQTVIKIVVSSFIF